MKLTIVIDTEDERGIRDSFKIVNHFYKKVDARGYGREVKFRKIALIKILRKYMKGSIEHLNDEASDQVRDIGDMGNLRNAKRFADRLFSETFDL